MSCNVRLGLLEVSEGPGIMTVERDVRMFMSCDAAVIADVQCRSCDGYTLVVDVIIWPCSCRVVCLSYAHHRFVSELNRRIAENKMIAWPNLDR